MKKKKWVSGERQKFIFRREWYDTLENANLSDEQKLKFLTALMHKAFDIRFTDDIEDEYLKGVLAKPLYDIEHTHFLENVDTNYCDYCGCYR